MSRRSGEAELLSLKEGYFVRGAAPPGVTFCADVGP